MGQVTNLVKSSALQSLGKAQCQGLKGNAVASLGRNINKNLKQGGKTCPLISEVRDIGVGMVKGDHSKIAFNAGILGMSSIGCSSSKISSSFSSNRMIQIAGFSALGHQNHTSRVEGDGSYYTGTRVTDHIEVVAELQEIMNSGLKRRIHHELSAKHAGLGSLNIQKLVDDKLLFTSKYMKFENQDSGEVSKTSSEDLNPVVRDKRSDDDYNTYHGQESGDSNDGIGRYYNWESLWEGQFKGEKLEGFGRRIMEDGAYHIGWYADGIRHGYGKYVYPDGKVLDGLWNNSVFIGAEDTNKIFKDTPELTKKFNEKDYTISDPVEPPTPNTS